MATFIQTKVTGAKDIEKAFKTLGAKIRTGVLRRSVRAGAAAMLKALKIAAPRETGLLRKSLGIKAKSFGKGLISATIIGPRSGFKREVLVNVKDRNGKIIGKKKQWRNPRKYAHILEKRRPWIRPTHAAHSGQAVQVVSAKLKAELIIAIAASSTSK